MTAALVLLQDVDLALELGVRMDGTGLSQNLSALDVGALHATEQSADVVARLGVIQDLPEHLDTGDDGLLLLVGQTNDLHLVAALQLATLHTAGSHGAAAGDGEHVLNRHQEGQVGLTVGGGDVVIHSVHQVEDALVLGGVDIGRGALQHGQGGTLDDGGVVAGEVVLGQQVADLHLDQVQQLLSEYDFPGDDTPIVKGSALAVLESTSTDINAPEYKCILDLMDAVDSYIPTPDRMADKPFLMPVEDVFTITGRGTVATGRVEQGQIKVGEEVEIVGLKDELSA